MIKFNDNNFEVLKYYCEYIYNIPHRIIKSKTIKQVFTFHYLVKCLFRNEYTDVRKISTKK